MHMHTQTDIHRHVQAHTHAHVHYSLNHGHTIRVFGVYIKDAEQEVYHCYAFEAEGTNRDVAIAFGLVEIIL